MTIHRLLNSLLAVVAIHVGLAAARLAAGDTQVLAPPRLFGTPEQAVIALKAAVASGDRARLEAIFGSGLRELLSGDPKQDSIEFAAFSTLIAEYSHVVINADDRATVNLGVKNWPFPVPLVRREAAWFFDTQAGKEEIINRRVGEDELNAIAVCRTYVAAQREYQGEDHVGDGVFRYAQHLKSTAGQKDGLYWPPHPDEEESPFGPLVAEAREEGYGGKTAQGEPQPYKGYRFKVLTRQGASAPGAAYDYIINGNMVAGFALVAYPVHWGESGVMTFVVNQWGRVYERNLGLTSEADALAMTEFNPDADWKVVAAP